MSSLLFTKFRFIQLSWWQHQSLPKSFHESQYDCWSSRMPTISSIYSKHAGCVLRLLNRTDCYVVALSTELVAVHVWNAPDQWHNWRVAGGTNRPPVKLNVNTGPLHSLYFGIYYSFGFSRLLFFGVFRSVFRWFRFFIAIQYRICYCFSTIFCA